MELELEPLSLRARGPLAAAWGTLERRDLLVVRVAAVREAAGPRMALRLDANGAWSVEEAVAALRDLAPLRIELCEEPAAGGPTAARAGRAALAGGVPAAPRRK